MKLSPRKSQTARGLRDLQKLMATAVIRPLARGDRMQIKWIDGQPAKILVNNFIKPNNRLTSFERLEIYNRQYWFRLRDCFYVDYPGLRAILGDRKFERLADLYLAQNPSHSFTLRNLGSRLVKFLEANSKLTAPRSPLALDMARLEWAHIEAFDSEAKVPLQTDEILDANPSKLRLQLQPHLTLLKLHHRIDDFLIALKKNAGLRSEASNAVEQNHPHKKIKLARKLKREINFLAVHRFDDGVYYKSLDEGQFRVLSALQKGATLEKACARLAGLEISGDLGENIKKWFANWTALGWFCGVKK